jgi:transcriptional regulator with XRE-family HTH domain
MKTTGAQLRAARAFLKWTIADLAQYADVAISTIRAVERADGEPEISGAGLETTREYRAGARKESVTKIVVALEKAGITFLSADARGTGIRRLTKS